jgi:hypothetical protein
MITYAYKVMKKNSEVRTQELESFGWGLNPNQNVDTMYTKPLYSSARRTYFILNSDF